MDPVLPPVGHQGQAPGQVQVQGEEALAAGGPTRLVLAVVDVPLLLHGGRGSTEKERKRQISILKAGAFLNPTPPPSPKPLFSQAANQQKEG